MKLSTRQRETVARTLLAALESAAARGGWPPADGDRPKGSALEPGPGAPKVGAVGTVSFRVADSDTAAAMGHPDQEVTVLASPQLALWFERASGAVMPPPIKGIRHLGVGIFVHHLAPAYVGEIVEVSTEVVAVEGRRVVLDCEARVGDRLVAFGTHQRILRPV